MDTLKKRFTEFLLNNNVWIHLISLLVVSFMWVMTFYEFFSLVYLNPIKWILFFKLFGVLVVLMLPLLGYSLLRDRMLALMLGKKSWLIWGIVFIGYPILIGLWGWVDQLIPVRMDKEMITFFGLILAGIDLVTNPQRDLKFFMKKYDSTKKINIEWLVVFLFLIFSIYMTFSLSRLTLGRDLFFVIWPQVLLFTAVYYLFYLINHYYLIEQVYRKKGIFYYGFGFLLLMCMFFIPIILMYTYFPSLSYFTKLQISEKWIGPNAPQTFNSIYLVSVTNAMLAILPFTIIVNWLNQSSKITNLQKEKSESELDLLRQQINPHFFFNTLNNVYSMSLTKDERTPEGILQLSDLMRYVIYKGQASTVTLNEEIKYIEDYLNLQRMRVQPNLDLKFNEEISNGDLHVTPLLFIILIENAFKHGVEGADTPSHLYINLREKNGRVVLECINSYDKDSQTKEVGVGLKNLKRRLDLIYPDNHSIEVTQTNIEYSVILAFNIVQ